ncbi:kinase-like domain-containing protein [Glomus cerebriforme]|uniref:Kinase-like domain-containing protein n=1 Tax=Glomus cerebriforme TaxID=658196 RepID=A0A397TES3_9GLOM|nr:kinase-like domain-containing protein [Glomus cerebriforme]
MDPKKSADTLNIYESDKRSDVYSIGMLLWRISSKSRPFYAKGYNTNLAVATCISNGEREKIVDGTPVGYSKLYIECWNCEPDERPDMKRVVSTLNQLKSDNEILKKSPDDYQKEEYNATKRIKKALQNKIVNFISFNDLVNPEPLDKGGFGHVTRVTWTKTNNYVVYKKLTNTNAVKYDISDAFIHELQIHLHIDYSDRIIRCLGISQDETTKEYLLVMQYADGGDLRNYLKNNLNLNWTDKKNLACQIAEGLNYLHNENVLHRDLHSKNIVIHENKAKIIDFGISRIQDQKSEAFMRDRGVLAYVEPKRIFNPNFPYTKSSDIYSFGVLMWEISSGRPPFKNNSYSKNEITMLGVSITNGAREKTIPNTPKEYEILYKNCWDQEPDKRPTICKVIEEFANMGFGVNIKNKLIGGEFTGKCIIKSNNSDLQSDMFIKT